MRCGDAFPTTRRTRLFRPGACSSCPATIYILIRSADLPVDYIQSSDMQVVAAHKADHCEPHLLSDRREGKCILSTRHRKDGLPLQRPSSLKSWGRGAMRRSSCPLSRSEMKAEIH
jgi:hypothetical protein